MACLLCIGVALAVILASIKLYLKLHWKTNGSKVILRGKTTIVTGANTGIGYETALDFAARGARVILACRNVRLAEEARRKIIAATKNDDVLVKQLDLSSLESVRAFAKDVNDNEERLDILVNNAGVIKPGNYKTQDGLHITMQTNHFGPFLLTNLLINKLKKSAPSRIVNVSSLGASVAEFDISQLNDPIERSGLLQFLVGSDYVNSKLCNILMSNELAKRLHGTGVTSNSLHPGSIKTEIARNQRSFSSLAIIVMNPFLRDPESGAQTQIYAAVSDELEGLSGKYLDNCTIVNMYDTVSDDLARKVWEESEKLVKLGPEERQL